jgi:hypothetical protein
MAWDPLLREIFIDTGERDPRLRPSQAGRVVKRIAVSCATLLAFGVSLAVGGPEQPVERGGAVVAVDRGYAACATANLCVTSDLFGRCGPSAWRSGWVTIRRPVLTYPNGVGVACRSFMRWFLDSNPAA